MADKTPLHILFTINCDPPTNRTLTEGPRTWELSGRAIEGFCNQVLAAGYLPTVFAAASCAAEQSPLLEEVQRRGGELALYLHPPHIGEGQFKRFLGQYNADDQRAIIDYAAEAFADALGTRPRSIRTGFFSASNDTFRILYELGFRQSSLSEPGRMVPIHAAQWDGAVEHAHYVDQANRLQAGTLPFLELPVTTDPTEMVSRGMPFALTVESGTVAALHKPTIERQLELMKREQRAFRSICISTCNRIDYLLPDEKHAGTLDELFDYLDTLTEEYTLIPVTANGAHEHYRSLNS